MVEKKWLPRHPLETVKGIGKVRHGKEQLRIDEARRWMVEAKRQADAGQAGAVAAMMALVMGMRASEIVSRVVRDLDDGGTLLWIADSKTLAGRRKLQVPEFLQPSLVAHAVASALGHESFKTTAESYAKREAVADAQQKRALAVLTGGRIAS